MKNHARVLKGWAFWVGRVVLCGILISSAWAIPRIKDIANVDDIRDNMLVGYGIVVGLNGTGDSKDMKFTQVSLSSMLERLGIKSNGADNSSIATKNIAAVIVTAVLPPFARHGSRIDISVSSLGDAKSLLGGTLLVTPLYGADGEVYAVAQGPVAASGYSAGASAGGGGGGATASTSISKGVPTSGRIANGAIIEKEVGYELAHQKKLRLSLRNPDFTTARRVADAINHKVGQQAASAVDPTTIHIDIPQRYQKDIVHFMTEVEQIRVAPDQVARVVIHDSEGVVVMGENVRINPVAITHGSLSIRISTSTSEEATTAVVAASHPQTLLNKSSQAQANADVREEVHKMTVLETGVTLEELVNALNSLGSTPRDLISILQTIKAAGALQADVEVM